MESTESGLLPILPYLLKYLSLCFAVLQKEQEILQAIEPGPAEPPRQLEPLENVLASMKFTPTAPPTKDEKEELSCEAQQVLQVLRDFSFMQSTVLMFPYKDFGDWFSEGLAGSMTVTSKSTGISSAKVALWTGSCGSLYMHLYSFSRISALHSSSLLTRKICHISWKSKLDNHVCWNDRATLLFVSVVT